jgi:hypothetical protein
MAMPILPRIAAALALLAPWAVSAQPAGADPAAQVAPETKTVPASTLRRDDLRVGGVAYRLALGGRGQCSDSFPLTGLLFHHLAEYEPKDRPTMIARHGLDRGLGILSVIADSPAAGAGLVAGDVLLSANGRAFPAGAAIARERKPKKWRRLADAAELQLEAALRGGLAKLVVLRQGKEVPVTLGAESACLGRVRLARSTQTNAFANGHQVVMTTAMLAFLKSDDELAVVLGHELAHNILRHPSFRDDKGLPDEGLLHALGVKPSRVWRSEEEADRLGLRLMAAAGYDLDAALPFWRRYLSKYDWFPQIFRSHPSLGARERIAADEIAQIRAEQAR